MCPYLGTVTTAGVFMTEVGWRGAPHTGPKGRGGDPGLEKKPGLAGPGKKTSARGLLDLTRPPRANWSPVSA